MRRDARSGRQSSSRLASPVALLCTVVVSGLSGLSAERLCFRPRKISAAAADPYLAEMKSQQIEMDDPVVPPGASAMRTPGGQLARGSSPKVLLLPLEK